MSMAQSELENIKVKREGFSLALLLSELFLPGFFSHRQ